MAEVDAGLFEPCPSWAWKVYAVFLGLDVVHDLWDDSARCHVCGVACDVMCSSLVVVKSGIVCSVARKTM